MDAVGSLCGLLIAIAALAAVVGYIAGVVRQRNHRRAGRYFALGVVTGFLGAAVMRHSVRSSPLLSASAVGRCATCPTRYAPLTARDRFATPAWRNQPSPILDEGPNPRDNSINPTCIAMCKSTVPITAIWSKGSSDSHSRQRIRCEVQIAKSSRYPYDPADNSTPWRQDVHNESTIVTTDTLEQHLTTIYSLKNNL